MKIVSVIIPTYKRPLYLKRAIDSVLHSSYSNYEVIVVDDNSDGDSYRLETEKLMNEYFSNNRQVIYIKHTCNKNGSAARNTGIKNSSGDYIMFLDDDDEFLPLKIEKQVEYMNVADNSFAACYTKYIDVFQNGKTRKGIENRSGNMYVNELARNFFVHAGSNLLIRRSVVEEIGGFDESFRRNQDIEFLVRILRKYKIGFVNYVGLKVYLHPRKALDYNEITEKYISTFSKDINSLDAGNKEKVYKLLGLQLIRYNIGEKAFKKAIGIKKKYRISSFLIVKYYCHLLRRSLFHVACGFNIK